MEEEVGVGWRVGADRQQRGSEHSYLLERGGVHAALVEVGHGEVPLSRVVVEAQHRRALGDLGQLLGDR